MLLAMFDGASRGAVDAGLVRAAARRHYELQLARNNHRKAAVAAYNLGNHLRCAGECEEALAWFDAAANSDPQYLDRSYLHRERANCSFELGDFSRAADEFEEAIKLGDDFPWLPLLFSDALTGCGRYLESAAQCQLAIDLPDPLGAAARMANRANMRAAELFGEVQHRVTDVSFELGWESEPSEVDGALEQDATIAFAWLLKARRAEDPLEDLICAAVFSRYDPAVLAAASYQALVGGDEIKAHDLITLGRRHGGHLFIEDLRNLCAESQTEDLYPLACSMFDDAEAEANVPTLIRVLSEEAT